MRLLAQGAGVWNLEHFFGCNANGQPRSPVIVAETTLRPDALIIGTYEPGDHYVRVNGPGSGGEGPGLYALTLEVAPNEPTDTLCANAERLRPGVQALGDTSQASNSFEGPGQCASTGPDRVFALEIDRRSRVRIAGEFGYEYASLYLRRTCNPGTPQYCGSGQRDRNDAELAIDTVLDRGRYFVFVDGDGDTDDGAGPFGLLVTLDPEGSIEGAR